MIEDTMMIGGGKMTSRKEEGPAVTETTLTEESLPQAAAGTLPPPHLMAGDTEHDTGAKNVYIKTTFIFVILSTSNFLSEIHDRSFMYVNYFVKAIIFLILYQDDAQNILEIIPWWPDSRHHEEGY